MELDHSFTVSASPEEAWRALTDVPRVARCMPGAALDEGSSDPFTGTVKVKVGAVAVKFRGELRFSELDESTHSLQLDCRGKDVRGASGASALIGMVLAEKSAGSTEVRVTTNLQLSGKIAQFGRGMLQDVSNAILQRFVSNLERDLRGGGPGNDPSAGTAPVSKSAGATSQPGEPASGATPDQSATSTSAGPSPTTARSTVNEDDDMIDLGATVLPVMLKRYGATALSGVATLLALWALIRSFGRTRPAGCRSEFHRDASERPPLLVVHRWSEHDR